MMKTTLKIVFIQGPVIVNVRTGKLLRVCPEGAKQKMGSAMH